ncbi:hypothetical protein KBC04_04595 [Candidatus Babeliales bacterium]|nr:hypothetical protein [Candidatus Babeliales bacterium]MBP9844100.1 hypothetical protein [Candidatus Babeliales bacterium]
MNDYKTIKKVFSLAWYDFSNNFTNWFAITGLHAIFVMLVFSALSFILGNFDVSFWAWLPNLFLDWADRFNELLYFNEIYDVYGIGEFLVGLFLSCGIILPLIIFQNSLDLAFDSLMRGMQVTGPLLSYFCAMILSHVVLAACFELMSYGSIYGAFYLLQHNIFINLYMIKICIFVVTCLFLYIMQLLYIFVMHVLEYQKGLWISVQEFYSMQKGKVLFLAKMLCLQILIAVPALIFIYYSFGTIIQIVTKFIFWFFELFQINLNLTFVFMLNNFFYIWVYILLYAWVCLVTAHVYRQLVCPPIQNVSCSSCTSCEKTT